MHKLDFNDHFDHKFNTYNQTEFESWFAELAGCVWGNDFERIKAGGKHGDKKSDGRRISMETVYQCYAPESPQAFAKKAVAKIDDSFPEVLKYWPNLKEWVFIHNNSMGITAKISDRLEKLRANYPHIKISTASRRFLKDELHDKLNMQQMLDIYPNASLKFRDVRMKDIDPLLKRIIKEMRNISEPKDFGDIPDEAKLDYNALGRDSEFNLRRARPNLRIVDRYIERMSNPANASVLQSAMCGKYLELKDFEYDPDEILGQLITFVSGDDHPTRIAAAYVIVVYYFDACDIFENVPGAMTC